MDVYEKCPVIEDERFLLRLIEEKDVQDLLKVYSDKRALPFFNSDNCNGDNFYYTTEKRMLEAIRMWLWEYSEKRYVRFAIVDKAEDRAVGTIELFNRQSDDFFHDCGLLRLDLGYEYENSKDICDILSLIMEPAYRLFHCTMIATKARNYAVDRIDALEKMHFTVSNEYLKSTHDGKVYDSYWVKMKLGNCETDFSVQQRNLFS